MKRLTCLMLCILLTFSFSASIYAVESKAKLSDMSEMECFEFIKAQGVEIPSDYEDETIWAPFVKQTILQVEYDPYCVFLYSYTVTENFAENIRTIVNDYYGVAPESPLSLQSSQTPNSRYVLQNSTPIGSWNAEYRNYNCYAYAVECIDDKYNPGEILDFMSGTFSLSNSDQANFDTIRMDLLYLGYHCIVLNPTNISYNKWNDGFRAICYRFGMYDYHFMRMDSSYWSHKPGESQPLRFHYWPYDTPRWSNEGVYEGVAMNYTTEYTSPVKFVMYCVPEVQYIGNNRHVKHCPGCDTDIATENCSQYTYCGNLNIGDYHKRGCQDCGNIVSDSMTECRFSWIPYGLYNGVACHIRGCSYCGHTNGGTPQPCSYSAPGMCDTCG